MIQCDAKLNNDLLAWWNYLQNVLVSLKRGCKRMRLDISNKMLLKWALVALITITKFGYSDTNYDEDCLCYEGMLRI